MFLLRNHEFLLLGTVHSKVRFVMMRNLIKARISVWITDGLNGAWSIHLYYFTVPLFFDVVNPFCLHVFCFHLLHKLSLFTVLDLVLRIWFEFKNSMPRRIMFSFSNVSFVTDRTLSFFAKDRVTLVL